MKKEEEGKRFYCLFQAPGKRQNRLIHLNLFSAYLFQHCRSATSLPQRWAPKIPQELFW